MRSEPVQKTELLVLYDGVCGLCDRSVQFLLAHDRAEKFCFAPLQGETAAAVYRRHFQRQPPAEYDSILLVQGFGTAAERVLQKSPAALEILRHLGGGWKLLAILGKIFPRGLRNAVYDAIANRRYRWFGKYDQCRLPDPAHRRRFLP